MTSTYSIGQKVRRIAKPEQVGIVVNWTLHKNATCSYKVLWDGQTDTWTELDRHLLPVLDEDELVDDINARNALAELILRNAQ